MKKNRIYVCLLACLIFAGCDDDFNERHFDGLDEMGTVKNVATYEVDYAGKYPKDGYFSTKNEVTDSVAKWLTATYFSCDSGSIARVALQYADSLEIPKEAGNSYTLTAEDYEAMGEGSNMPGKDHYFSASVDPLHYLPVFLKQKYPYAFAEEVKGLTYAFYGSDKQVKDSTSSFYYDGNTWTYLGNLPRVAVSKRIAEFEYGSKWKFSKIIGGIEKYTLVHDDFQALYNWTKEHKPEYLAKGSTTDEYYFGAQTSYNQINNNVYSWKNSYNINGEYTGKSDDEVREIMHARMSEGLAGIVLPLVYGDPKSGVNYQVTYSVYRGLIPNYVITFMYDDAKKEFYRTAGPDF